MDATSHQPSKWEDMEHCHMNHDLWGKFGTYLVQHANNKTILKIPLDKNTASKKSVISRKLSRTATSTKDVSQRRLSDESDILLKNLDQQKSLRMKPKSYYIKAISSISNYCSRINIMLLTTHFSQHNYYASNNTHF